MPKTVLLVSAVYLPEPVVSAHISFDLYESLVSKGIKVTVLHPRPTRPNGFHFDVNYVEGYGEVVTDSYTCPKSSLLGRFRESLSFGKATYRYIEQHKDCIEAIYANTWPLFGQYYLAKAAIKHQIPYYIHIHDIYPESYGSKLPGFLGMIFNKVLLPIDKYVLRLAKRVICISPTMIDYLCESRNLTKNRFVLVRNWQDDQKFINAYKPILKMGDDYHFMYLGSINPTANIPLIIRAFANIAPCAYRLSIIGDGPEKSGCLSLAQQLGRNVIFGTATSEQVAEMQGKADVLVLCLKKGVAKTATPSKLTAYMFSGRPIIASVDLDSDCASIIKEAGCGVVVEPDNEIALGNAMQNMSNKSLGELNEMGKSAFEYAMANFSKESNLSVLTDLIAQSSND